MKLRITLVIAVVIPCATAQTAEGPSFERRMYAIERLDQHNPRQFAGLPDGQKRDFLACRNAVIAVLKGIETKNDLHLYLTPELARKYPSTEALGASLIERETSLLAVGVSEFNLNDEGNRIRLTVFVLVFSEGMIGASEKVAYCERSGGRWRISGFE